MNTVTYKDMIARYGNTQAFDLLLTVEKLAKTGNGINALDEETRFRKALEALETINFAN